MAAIAAPMSIRKNKPLTVAGFYSEINSRKILIKFTQSNNQEFSKIYSE